MYRMSTSQTYKPWIVTDWQCNTVWLNAWTAQENLRNTLTRGGAHPARVPRLKLEKNMIFWRKIVIFHTKYPNNFRASLRNWKKYYFLAENRDFSHEISKKCSCLPPLGAIFFTCAQPNLKSWIRLCSQLLFHFKRIYNGGKHISCNESSVLQCFIFLKNNCLLFLKLEKKKSASVWRYILHKH